MRSLRIRQDWNLRNLKNSLSINPRLRFWNECTFECGKFVNVIQLCFFNSTRSNWNSHEPTKTALAVFSMLTFQQEASSVISGFASILNSTPLHARTKMSYVIIDQHSQKCSRGGLSFKSVKKIRIFSPGVGQKNNMLFKKARVSTVQNIGRLPSK